MSRSTLALLGAMLALTACLNTSEPFGPEQNYGFVFLEANSVDGEYVTDPNAVFYRASRLQLPSTNGLNEGCLVGIFSTEDGVGQVPPNVSAGPNVQIGLSGETVQLTPVSQGVDGTRYVNAAGGSVPYNPGDVATITVPGAEEEFPSWTLSAKTAEPFTPTAVETPADPVQIPLRWTAASSSGSKMIVSLRYPAPDGEGLHQIYCELVDDGVYDLDPQVTAGWRGADDASRQAVWSRWRITAEAKTGSALLVISTFQVPFDDASL